LANGDRRFRVSDFRNPGLFYGNVEDPGDLVNLEEQIPCIAACGIRSNTIWNPIVSRGNSWPYLQEAEASEQPAADAATDVQSPEGVEAEDLVEEERFESSELIPAMRNDKRASCVACIVVSPRALKALIVISIVIERWMYVIGTKVNCGYRECLNRDGKEEIKTEKSNKSCNSWSFD
jgi:hypothetical protein